MADRSPFRGNYLSNSNISGVNVSPIAPYQNATTHLGAATASSVQRSAVSPSRLGQRPFQSSGDVVIHHAMTPPPQQSATMMATTQPSIRNLVSDSSSNVVGNSRRHEDLLGEAQSHVRELLPYKEEAVRLQAELRLATQRIAAKDEEIERLHSILAHERQERDSCMRAATEKMHTAAAVAEAHSHKHVERTRELESMLAQHRAELDRKETAAKGASAELVATAQQLSEERAAHEATRKKLEAAAEKCRLLAACEDDALKCSAAAESRRRAIVEQLEESDSDRRKLRVELENATRRKNDLLSERARLVAERDSLSSQVAAAAGQEERAAKLEKELARMTVLSEKASSLQDVLSDKEDALANERSLRRTAEFEKEQITGQLNAAKADLQRMHNELQIAKCDAAERLSVQRELDETRSALSVLQQTANELQENLQDAQDQETHAKRLYELLSSAVSECAATARQECEQAATAAAPLLLPASPRRQRLAADTSYHSEGSGGDVTPSKYGVNSRGGLSTLHHDASNTSAVSAHKQQQQRRLWQLQMAEEGECQHSAAVVFHPLRVAIAEIGKMLHEEKTRRTNLQKDLTEEVNQNYKLNEALRSANAGATASELKCGELEGKNGLLSEKLSKAEGELQQLAAIAKENICNLAKMLLPASTTAQGEASASLVPSWDAIQFHTHRVVHEGQILRSENAKLQVDVAEKTRTIAAERAKAAEELSNERKQKEEQTAALSGQIAKERKAAHTQATQLKEALKTAAGKHQQALEELEDVNEKLTRTLERLADEQSMNSTLTMRLEAEVQNVEDLKGTVEELKGNLTQALAAVDSLQNNLSEVNNELHRAETLQKKTWDALLLMVRAASGLRSSLRTSQEHTRAALQIGRNYEKALNIVAQEAPAGSLAGSAAEAVLRPPKSMRVGAIAVLAFNRFAAMLQVIRAAPRRTKPKARSTIPIPRLWPPEVDVLPRDVSLEPADTEPETVQGLLLQFEGLMEVSPAEMHKRRREAGGLLRLLSSGRINRSVGPTALARHVSQRFQQRRQEHAAAERELVNLRNENNSLASLIQVKEAQNQRFSKHVSDLLNKTSQMVQPAVHENVVQELHRVRSSLESEQTGRKDVESQLSDMQRREVELLARQNALHSEAKALAVELASTRTRSVSPRIATHSVSPFAVPQEPTSAGLLGRRSGTFSDIAYAESNADDVAIRSPAAAVEVSKRTAMFTTNEFLDVPATSGFSPPGSPRLQLSRQIRPGSGVGSLLTMIHALDDRISGALKHQ